MLPVQQREALSVEWVAEFDQEALRRPHPVHSHDVRFEPALKTIRGAAGGSSLQHASRGALTVLFDGVLYERRELARALDVRTADANDAALVLQAHARWGENFLDHIKGLFAIVAWDATTTRLIAARDPFGEYPLFFADLGGRGFLFSKSIDALLADPRVGRTLNRAALADHLCQRWPDPGETFFAAIRRVIPGHRLVATPTGLVSQRYWDPFPPDGRAPSMSADDLDEFDFRLETAVERMLRQGPSGILLSGGLDSVSVASATTDVARRHDFPLPIAFSLAYPPPSSEEPIQRGVAATLQIPQEIVPFWKAVGGRSLLTQTLRLSQTYPVMLNSPWTPAYDHLIDLASQRGLQTMMTGIGGDEAFALNPLYAADAMRRGDVRALVSHVAAWRRSYSAPISWHVKGMLWEFGLRAIGVSALEHILPKPLNKLRVRRSMRFAAAYVAPEPGLKAELERRVLRSCEARKTSGPLYLREATDRLEHPIASQAREEHYERGRRTGVHLRHPLCDADVMALVYRMPHSLIYGDGRAKYPLRRRLVGRFPTLGFDRQKKLGGTGLFRSILASELPALWRTDSLSALDRLGVVDIRGAEAMVIGALQSENKRSLLQVWELLRLAAWAESRL